MNSVLGSNRSWGQSTQTELKFLLEKPLLKSEELAQHAVIHYFFSFSHFFFDSENGSEACRPLLFYEKNKPKGYGSYSGSRQIKNLEWRFLRHSTRDEPLLMFVNEPQRVSNFLETMERGIIYYSIYCNRTSTKAILVPISKWPNPSKEHIKTLIMGNIGHEVPHEDRRLRKRLMFTKKNSIIKFILVNSSDCDETNHSLWKCVQLFCLGRGGQEIRNDPDHEKCHA